MMNEILKAKILSWDASVPRYTSYPSAPHFKADFNVNTYESWLKDLPPNSDISLYVHIPFCSQMCFYCGCHTKVTKRYEPITSYLYLLQKEVALLREIIPASCRISHLHFGGGSPTMLDSGDFTALMKYLRQSFYFQDNAEIAIEADPRQMTRERIQAYAATGVNRISLGVQDIHDDTMAAVNRVQPFSLTENAVQWLREAGVNRINMDVMYGLPHQTVDTMRDTMTRLLALKPDRVSFFGYAHVPWMKKHMQLMPQEALPDKSLRYDLAAIGAEILVQHDYHAIGIDHYVRGDDPMKHVADNRALKRNFQGYTTDNATALIGLGASSISKLPQGYVQNTPHNVLYKQALDAGHLPIAKGFALSANDALWGGIIESLMCTLRVDLNDYTERFHVPFCLFEDILAYLQPMQHQGLLTMEQGVITIAPEARHITRVVCAAFDRYLDTPSGQRHSKAV